jgi:hypothetical protein
MRIEYWGFCLYLWVKHLYEVHMAQPETVVLFPAKTEPAKKISSTEQIWGKAVMTHGYTAVPVIMVRAQSRLGINATQFNILVQLLEYWRNPERRPFPTKKEIAGRIGLTEKTVQLNIRALEKAGLVQREQRKSAAGDWSSNVYHLDGLIARVRKMEPEFSEERRKKAEERRKVETPKGVAERTGVKKFTPVACKQRRYRGVPLKYSRGEEEFKRGLNI